jgi:hypothetical protein
MLMHCMLFNLRIQARDPALKSDVRFVLGNHEIVSVFGFGYASDEWISEYVCERHTEFATPRSAPQQIMALRPRALMLAPFYMCSPFLLIRFGSILFAHGGFVPTQEGGDLDTYTQTVLAQKQIDEAVGTPRDGPLIRRVAEIIHDYRNTMGHMSVAEVRGHAELSLDAMCKRAVGVESAPSALSVDKIELVVVGHCVTHANRALVDEFKEMCPTDGETVGCVVTRECARSSGVRLMVALVDTGMASCFRTRNRDNMSREISMLALVNKDAGAASLNPITAHDKAVTGHDALYAPHRAWVGPLPMRLTPILFDLGRRAHV